MRRWWYNQANHTTLAMYSLYLFAQPQLTSCFSALEVTGLDIQSGCHRWETICQPQHDGLGIAGRRMCAIPQTSLLGMKLEDRDDGVYHCLGASGRNMILKRATYKCTIITIIKSLEEYAEVVLQARVSKQPSPRRLAWSCLSILWCCRPALMLSPLPTNAVDRALPAS